MVSVVEVGVDSVVEDVEEENSVDVVVETAEIVEVVETDIKSSHSTQPLSHSHCERRKHQYFRIIIESDYAGRGAGEGVRK